MLDPRGPARPRSEGEQIESVPVHPVFDKAFVTAEHPEGQLEWLGDALGMDFMVVRFVDGWARMYRGNGKVNEDWFSWGENVLAPFDGIVRFIAQPTGTNLPGKHSGGKGGGIVFERGDGVFVAYGHVADIAVVEGEQVVAGQVVAKVGNNGTSWLRHLHAGAWKGDRPLQIRVNLTVMGNMLKDQGEQAYYGMTAKPYRHR